MENTIKNYGLTDKEVEALYRVNETPEAIDAIYKVVLASIYSNGVIQDGVKPKGMLNWAIHIAQNDVMSLEEKGKALEATASGINYLEDGVNKIKAFVRPVEKVTGKKTNNAV
jgi:hypothetical protein